MSNRSDHRRDFLRGLSFALRLIFGIGLLAAMGFAASRAGAAGAVSGGVPALRASLFDAFPAGTAAHTPAIAIVIDDLGNNPARTRRAIALPSAVTLSFLPYPEGTPALANEGARDGHEILLHMPMQPVGVRHDPGPMALKVSQSPQEITRRLQWALSRVPHRSGVNNHEGSRFTRDREALAPVMQTLAQENLFFLDSRTTAHSQAIRVAHAYDVPVAGRDVFLDDVQTKHAVARQLAKLEAVARRNGVAIAIGHPHAVTLSLLGDWTRDARSRGYRLIALRDAIRMKEERGALKSFAENN